MQTEFSLEYQNKHMLFFIHKEFSKQIVMAHTYLMVPTWIVKNPRCKVKLWDTLMSLKHSVQEEVLRQLGEPND